MKTKDQVLTSCPLCGSDLAIKQPQPGTHVFTIKYKCGSEIDYPFIGKGYLWGVSCDGKISRQNFSFSKKEE